MNDFNVQGDIKHTAWVFATASRKDASLFRTLSAAAQRRMVDFNPQGLANTAWVFAAAVQMDAPLFAALATSSQRRMNEFNPRQLHNTI